MALSWQCPPVAVCQCALYTFQTGRTPGPAPALSPFPNCLLQFLTLDNHCPKIFWGGILQGETHSKKHFQSVNVKDKEKVYDPSLEGRASWITV